VPVCRGRFDRRYLEGRVPARTDLVTWSVPWDEITSIRLLLIGCQTLCYH